MAGDLIIKIDDTPTKGMSLNEAVKLMRGAPKSPITLTIMRADRPQPIVLKIVRDIIKVRSVRSRCWTTASATSASPSSGKDRFRPGQAAQGPGRQGSPKGLVLDLRNDPAAS